VLQGESLSSMRMKEALDAVATANAIIWRASAGFQSTAVVKKVVDGTEPEAVLAGGDDGGQEQALKTLA